MGVRNVGLLGRVLGVPSGSGGVNRVCASTGLVAWFWAGTSAGELM